MSKGFFTIAQGAAYQRMAYGLALSLKISQPKELSNLSIGVTGDELKNVNPKYLEVFDNVIEIPWEDHAKNSNWKLENEWKSIYMSPYDETIKVDADMLFPSDISLWWDALNKSEGVFCTQTKTYRGDTITSDFYRKVFTQNNLPNVYSAFFYFKKTDINYEFFKLAEFIFNNWEKCFYEFFNVEHRPKFVSTDVVFGLAAKILDYEQYNNTLGSEYPKFVHMKSRLQNWPLDKFLVEDWTKIIPVSFNKDCTLKIGNFTQTLPFHYFVKDFLSDRIITTMEKKLGI